MKCLELFSRQHSEDQRAWTGAQASSTGSIFHLSNFLGSQNSPNPLPKKSGSKPILGPFTKSSEIYFRIDFSKTCQAPTSLPFRCRCPLPAAWSLRAQFFQPAINHHLTSASRTRPGDAAPRPVAPPPDPRVPGLRRGLWDPLPWIPRGNDAGWTLWLSECLVATAASFLPALAIALLPSPQGRGRSRERPSSGGGAGWHREVARETGPTLARGCTAAVCGARARGAGVPSRRGFARPGGVLVLCGRRVQRRGSLAPPSGSGGGAQRGTPPLVAVAGCHPL